MRITEFPDINWLRRKAQTNFQDKEGIRGIKLNHVGWPSIVLNTNSWGAERTNIRGTFSLFLNLEGTSIVRSSGRSFKVGTHNFALTELGNDYDLIIPEGAKTNTFNIHFGEHLFREAVNSLELNHRQSLDLEEGKQSLPGLTRSRIRTPHLNNQLLKLYNHYQRRGTDDAEEVLMSELIDYLLTSNEKEWRGKESIDCLKKSTGDELMRRLQLACDLMHQCYNREISLEEMSKVSMLSKFHFLRTFKEAFGMTPQSYKRLLQLKQAEMLIRTTETSVKDVAEQVGFQESNSLIRSFTRHFGTSPKRYRLAR